MGTEGHAAAGVQRTMRTRDLLRIAAAVIGLSAAAGCALGAVTGLADRCAGSGAGLPRPSRNPSAIVLLVANR